MSFSGFNSGPGFGSSNPSFGFGGGNLSPGFGASPSTFGAASTGSSLFGGASGFGGGNVFGTNPASSPFGGTGMTGMFGSTPTSGFGASSPFAGTSFGNASSAPFGGTSFGGGFARPSTAVTGTTQFPFSPYQESDPGPQSRNGVVSFLNISSMKVYEGYSPDELRAMDYQAGNKGGAGGSNVVPSFATGGSMFGGGSQPGYSFGSSGSGFTTGIGASGFGQSSSAAPFFSGGFSASSGSMFGGQNAPSVFRQNTQPFGAGVPFGQSSTAFGGFGASSSTSANIFGAATAPAANFGTSTSSVFGSFGQSSTPFGQTASAPSFGAQSSTPAFGGAAFGSGFAASSSLSFGFQQSGTGQSLFSASSGSMFGGGTANAFGASSSGTNMFGQSNTSMFGGASSGGSIFGVSNKSAPFGSFTASSQPSNIFGAQQSTPSFGGVAQNTTIQPQPAWGTQAPPANAQANQQNFSAIYGGITPDLPSYDGSSTQFKIGLRAAIPTAALGRKRLDREQMLVTWSRGWHVERKKQTWMQQSSQLSMSRWDNVRASPAHDMFQTRTSRELEEGPSNPSADDTEDTLWSEYKPRESLFSQPKTLDKLIDPDGGIEIDEEFPSAPSSWNKEDRLLTEREIKQRLPTIVDKEYYLKPDIRGLTNMLRGDPNALKEVYGLVIGRHGYGCIKYSVPINIEGADICSRIKFQKGGVVLFSDGSQDNPLDGACEVTLENIFLKDKKNSILKDKKNCEKMKIHLEKYCVTEGVIFVSYDNGTWCFKVDSLLS